MKLSYPIHIPPNMTTSTKHQQASRDKADCDTYRDQIVQELQELGLPQVQLMPPHLPQRPCWVREIQRHLGRELQRSHSSVSP